MKRKPPKQSEIIFKPTEFQLDLWMGKGNEKKPVKIFTSRDHHIKTKSKPSEE
jgi:hypothetical protein